MFELPWPRNAQKTQFKKIKGKKNRMVDGGWFRRFFVRGGPSTLFWRPLVLDGLVFVLASLATSQPPRRSQPPFSCSLVATSALKTKQKRDGCCNHSSCSCGHKSHCITFSKWQGSTLRLPRVHFRTVARSLHQKHYCSLANMCVCVGASWVRA